MITIDDLLEEVFGFRSLTDAVIGGGSGAPSHVIHVFLSVYTTFCLMATGFTIGALIMIKTASAAKGNPELVARAQSQSVLQSKKLVLATLFALPIPGGSGMNVLHAIVTASILLSIKGASMAYNSILDYMQENNFSISPAVVASPMPSDDLVRAAFFNNLCTIVVNNEIIEPQNQSSFFSSLESATGLIGQPYTMYSQVSGREAVIAWGDKPSVPLVDLGDNATACGKVVFRMNDSANSNGFDSQYAALALTSYRATLRMSESLYGPAMDMYLLLKGKHPDLNAVLPEPVGETQVPADNNQNRNAQMQIVKQIKDGILEGIRAYVQEWENASQSTGSIIVRRNKPDGSYYFALSIPDETAAYAQMIEEMRESSFVNFGTWYWTISRRGHMVAERTKFENDIGYPDPESGDIEPNVDKIYRFFSDAKRLVSEFRFDGEELHAISPAIPKNRLVRLEFPDDMITSQMSSDELLSAVWGNSFGVSAHAAYSLLLDDGDVMYNLANYGQWMIGTGSTLVMLSSIDSIPFVGKMGKILDKASEATGGGGIFSKIGGVLMTLGGALIAIGGMLAYYIPAVPLIYWIFGVLSILMAAAMTYMAVLIWAPAHLISDDSDSFFGRYALTGWQMLLNVIMRPILIVSGLLFAYFISSAMLKWGLHAYSAYNEQLVISTSSTAIWGILFSNIIMVLIAIAIVHVSHELIPEMADGVMQFVGFGVAPLGRISNVEGRVGGMQDRAGRRIEEAASGVAGKTATRRIGGGGGAQSSGGSSPNRDV